MPAARASPPADQRRVGPFAEVWDPSAVVATILICNYNYGRFLREAIDSALGQTHPHLDVVVVDDGSTDDSREIIASYGDRITAVVKENGGHASALNVGFVASRGAVVCLLDSDDRFLPEKVSRVLHAWQASPQAPLVYHQLQAVDVRGGKIGRPWPRGVWCGDIRWRAERSGGWWPHPTTSGLCFTRSYLERMLPIPLGADRIWPDTYLAGPAVFFGPVIGLRAPLALVRLHGHNQWNWGSASALDDHELVRERLRRRRDQYVAEFWMLRAVLSERLHLSPSLSLTDHLPYQRCRRAGGEPVSLARLLWLALRSPAMPASMRWREALKILLNRW